MITRLNFIFVIIVEVSWLFIIRNASLHLNSGRKGKGKGKGHRITGHKDPEGAYMYSSTLPSTSALDGVDGKRHDPAAYPQERPGIHCIGGQCGRMLKISPAPGFDPGPSSQ